MGRHFSFQPYQRTFVKPLRTALGEWSVREGFIVRVEDESRVGYGEVAPIPQFGSETVVAAEAYLQRLRVDSSLAEDAVALASLPCCAFGVSAALASESSMRRRDYLVAALLPAGRAALSTLAVKLSAGYETFKWKIGVEAVPAEQAIFRELVALLPVGGRLRLDANGGFSMAALESWLRVLQQFPKQVEYLEQPLAVGQEAAMAQLAASSCVPIALDESLHSEGGLRWFETDAWSGPLVVKPALMGAAGTLVERLRPVAAQVVLSSVFETSVGLENTLRIADQLPDYNLAIGFDTLAAFADGLSSQKSVPIISAVERTRLTPETIWKQLPKWT
jgi:O-succinylbenzoate synthase